MHRDTRPPEHHAFVRGITPGRAAADAGSWRAARWRIAIGRFARPSTAPGSALRSPVLLRPVTRVRLKPGEGRVRRLRRAVPRLCRVPAERDRHAHPPKATARTAGMAGAPGSATARPDAPACVRLIGRERIPARLYACVPFMFLAMSQGSLFPDPPPFVPDAEVVATLRTAIASAGRLPRSADLLLSGLCAEYLVAELRNAGLSIVRSQARDAGA